MGEGNWWGDDAVRAKCVTGHLISLTIGVAIFNLFADRRPSLRESHCAVNPNAP